MTFTKLLNQTDLVREKKLILAALRETRHMWGTMSAEDMFQDAIVGCLEARLRVKNKYKTAQPYLYLRIYGAIVEAIRSNCPTRTTKTSRPIRMCSYEALYAYAPEQAPFIGGEDPAATVQRRHDLQIVARIVDDLPALQRAAFLRFASLAVDGKWTRNTG